jgi:hypothetical protein
MQHWHARYQLVNLFLLQRIGISDKALDKIIFWHTKCHHTIGAYAHWQIKSKLKMDVQEEENGAERRS